MDGTKRARLVEDDDGAVGGASTSAAAAAVADAAAAAESGLVFEDPYEDVYESESGESDGEDDDDEDEDLGGGSSGSSSSAAAGSAAAGTAAAGGKAAKGSVRFGGGAIEADGDEDDEDEDLRPKDVWRPGIDALAEGEQLVCDMDAYVMYHAMAVEWPCLSFDVVPDRHGVRTKFPLSCTIVAGTQADRADHNRVMVMRFGALHKTQDDDKSEDDVELGDGDDDEGLDEDASVDVQRIAHHGAVNRVRVMPQEPHIVATWSETGLVRLYDIRPQVRLLDAAEGRGAAPPVPKGYGPV